MYTLKGFFVYDSLISNQLNTVAKFGELSENSKSYAKDKLQYSRSSEYPQTALVVFHTVKDEERAQTPDDIVKTALSIGDFILDRAMDGHIPSDGHQFRQNLSAEFAGQIHDVEVGVILDDMGFRMPEWIKYVDTKSKEDNEILIWLADDSFAGQYDEFHIEVTPPIQPLDNFFRDPVLVKEEIAQYDPVEITLEVQQKRGEYPFTQIQTYRYDYHNPVMSTDRTPTYWTVIIYGQAGNNPDAIREAIVKEVLDNSTHTDEEWAVILPDLFRNTEFIFAPLWNNYSVPNHEFQGGIYSPTLDPRTSINWVLRAARGTGFTDAYVKSRYEFTHHIYKSLAMSVVGNSQNRDGITQFSDMHSDYMVVTNNSPDFNRMSANTQELSGKLADLIAAAEDMTPYTRVPMGVSRVTRDGIVYSAVTFKNTNYLVASKYSAIEHQ